MSLILANKANSVLMGTTKMLPIWGGGGGEEVGISYFLPYFGP